MMKSIVDENLVSFKMLEQKIYDYVCELGRLITQQVLESYDAKLAETISSSGVWNMMQQQVHPGKYSETRL